MYVKALRVAGFKSFGDPITFELESGINAIVGPNGSGKSNIADAVSWVLGAQAPSSLRGASMEDVIFAGSETRAGLGMAEVELTLDNASGSLGLEVSEATISRSTDRSGVSEYKINGVACRLLDIAELLSDTGIGRSIHTVVGQGQLDVILAARPEERRAFIEEAAQIGKYRRRKDRALRRIERVEGNLVRLSDVMSELKRAIRPLRRQAAAASRYSELIEEHRALKQRLTATELQALSRRGAAFDPDTERRRAELLSDELAHVRATTDVAASEQESLARRATEQLALGNRLGRAGDRLEALGALASERAEHLGARLEAETAEGYRERIRLLENDRSRWAREGDALAEAAGVSKAHAEAAGAAAAAAAGALREHEAGLVEARAAETEAAQALVRAEGSAAAGRATLGSIEARARAAHERREVTARALDAERRRIDRARSEVAALEAELDTAVQGAAEAEARHEEERLRAEGLRAKLGASNADRAAAEARAQALRDVEALFEGRDDVLFVLGPLADEARGRVRLAAAGEAESARIAQEAADAVERRWAEVASKDEVLRHLDALMAGGSERLAGAQRAYEAREIELAALDDELARVTDALADAERAAIEDQASLPARRAALEEAGAGRARAESAWTELREAFEVARRAAATAALEERTAQERAWGAQLRLEEAETGIADARSALEGLAGRRELLEAARTRTIEVAGAARTAAGAAARWADDALRRAEGQRDEEATVAARLVSLRNRDKDLAERLEDVARVRNEAEIRRAETVARMDALAERAMDEWGLGTADLSGLEPLEGDEESWTVNRVGELERSMRALGGVNPRAGEEYAEMAERERFLTEQIDDLETSKRDLMKIVKEVDETIVTEFEAAFTAVAREFEVVFTRLFPGGRGAMRLADPGDRLSSGIEIEARPAGKRVDKLSLLSGGERSLVALAFLFALFRARPSPFYLLDEVEAALDDVNLHRFLALVSELRADAQVLIVTHQKRTMEAADVLYGVTMGSDGVSRVVARRMEDVPR